MRRPSISDFDLDMAVELIRAGQTAKSVAFSLGHDAGALRRALARRRDSVEALRRHAAAPDAATAESGATPEPGQPRGPRIVDRRRLSVCQARDGNWIAPEASCPAGPFGTTMRPGEVGGAGPGGPLGRGGP